MIYAEIASKLVIALIALWTMTKILGKKEISQLTAFDFVSSLMLSELVGNTVYDKEASIQQLLFALALWTLMSFGLEKLAIMFPWLSKRVSGSPVLLIRDGLVDEKALKKSNLDFDQLHMLLREVEVFSVTEVAYGIFETNGSLSVLRKSDKKASLPAIVIAKGQIDKDALRFLGKDEAWLYGKLREQGLSGTEQVAYAEWSDDKGLHVQRADDPNASFSVPVG